MRNYPKVIKKVYFTENFENKKFLLTKVIKFRFIQNINFTFDCY